MGDKTATEYAEALDASITQAQESEWLQSVSPSDWANESHAIARTIYADLPTRTAIIHLPANYGSAHKDAMELQLKRAGVRLAGLLNEAFSGSSPTSAPAVAVAGHAPSSASGRAVIHRSGEQRLHLKSRTVRE